MAPSTPIELHIGPLWHFCAPTDTAYTSITPHRGTFASPPYSLSEALLVAFQHPYQSSHWGYLRPHQNLHRRFTTSIWTHLVALLHPHQTNFFTRIKITYSAAVFIGIGHFLLEERSIRHTSMIYGIQCCSKREEWSFSTLMRHHIWGHSHLGPLRTYFAELNL